MTREYTLKVNQKRFFYPDEWNLFYQQLSEKQKPYFKIAINTGARINEVRNLRIQDIDFKKNTITFYVTKIRSKLKEKRPVPRTISISSEFSRWLYAWGRKNRLKMNDTFGIPSTVAVDKAMKTKLERLKFKDWRDFSSHNIRKTHGNWLKAMRIDGVEIAARLGHDINTMIKHYVSPDVFTEGDRALICRELGDLVERMSGRMPNERMYRQIDRGS